MSRYHSHFSQDKISASQARPSGGVGPGNKDGYREATANWPGAPGPKGPGINKLKWKEIKQSAKQDMPDDMGLELDPLAPGLGAVGPSFLDTPIVGGGPFLDNAPPLPRGAVPPLPRIIDDIPQRPSYTERQRARKKRMFSGRGRDSD